jgi:hypothetical protein
VKHVSFARGLAFVLRSRVVQFFAVGLVVWKLAPAPARTREVVVDSGVVANALRNEQARVARPLTLDEKQRVMADLVADEVLLREGLRLGVGVDDPIVRGRVADRMRGYLEASSPALVTAEEARSEAALEAARMPARIRLAVAFVSKERPDATSDADTLARSLARSPDAAPPYGGDRAPIEALATWSEDELARLAGASVARAAMETPVAAWSAPIASAWGFYIVRPVERRAATPEEALATAAASVRRRKQAAATERTIARLASDYVVTVQSPAGEPAFDARASAAPRARGGGVD